MLRIEFSDLQVGLRAGDGLALGTQYACVQMAYELLMDVATIDAYSRVVTWSARYTFSNEVFPRPCGSRTYIVDLIHHRLQTDLPLLLGVGANCVPLPPGEAVSSTLAADDLVIRCASVRHTIQCLGSRAHNDVNARTI